MTVTQEPAPEPLRDSLRPRGPVEFSVRRREQEGRIFLAVDGELDLLTAPRLVAELDETVHRQAGDVVLDLRGVKFIDSAGLVVLINARRRLERTSRRLAVICSPGPVRRVIELARLGDTLGLIGAPDEL